MQTPKASSQANIQLDRPDYSLRRYFIDKFYFFHVPNLAPNSWVLDLGGHKTDKRGQFDIEQYNLRIIYANLTCIKRPDIQADAAQVPLESGCFDAIICSELLEHVSNPSAVLRETYRLLADGGVVLICVPFLYRIHSDPYDFGRYTDHYWQTTLTQVGFQNIRIERQGLFFAVMADFIKQYAVEMGWPKRRRYRPLVQAVTWGQRWALRFEQKPTVNQHPFFQSFTTGFGIRASK